jgi:hypothetical protein
MRRTTDRRLFARYSASGLTAEVNGTVLAVKDISLGGMRLDGLVGNPSSLITFVISCTDSDGDTPITASGLVLRHGHTSTAIAFQSATLPLMKLVVRQASRQLGVDPYMVK